MQLHAVEARLLRVLRGPAERFDDDRQLVLVQLARNDELLAAEWRGDLPLRQQGRWANRQLPTQEIRVRYSPGVPELGEYAATGGVDRIGHLLPHFDLFGAVHARRTDVTDAVRADLGPFADEEPC